MGKRQERKRSPTRPKRGQEQGWFGLASFPFHARNYSFFSRGRNDHNERDFCSRKLAQEDNYPRITKWGAVTPEIETTSYYILVCRNGPAQQPSANGAHGACHVLFVDTPNRNEQSCLEFAPDACGMPPNPGLAFPPSRSASDRMPVMLFATQFDHSSQTLSREVDAQFLCKQRSVDSVELLNVNDYKDLRAETAPVAVATSCNLSHSTRHGTEGRSMFRWLPSFMNRVTP
ncbi:uncharacterized protein SPSK_03620 [Sporothrix schenckii 1099-18]|uniref:Uncharacterized protein n=1 Tax=Sporothrix schenckii 1099-18 TaxID=1397361 RepID=A0A0F2M2D0_SPOSC|nr:uncharacterized protein SPSK_03620 [Sporothrix schenckii 1099-18]KJR82291.1 hypothetical protein SPSK_03620 [Sporothrix schenckii 1099-18]